MGISARDVLPFTRARATPSGLAEQVEAGAETTSGTARRRG